MVAKAVVRNLGQIDPLLTLLVEIEENTMPSGEVNMPTIHL